MAALTITDYTTAPFGDRHLVVVACTISNNNNSTEWISGSEIGVSWVEHVLGITRLDGLRATVAAVPNAQGAGSMETSAPGDLGVEVSNASTYHVSFIARLKGGGRK